MKHRFISAVLAAVLFLTFLPVMAAGGTMAAVQYKDDFTAAPATVDLTEGYSSDVWAMTNGYSSYITGGNTGSGQTGFWNGEGEPRIALSGKTVNGTRFMEVTQLQDQTGITTQQLTFEELEGDGYDTLYTTFQFQIPSNNQNSSAAQWRLGARSNHYGIITPLLFHSNGYVYSVHGESGSEIRPMGYYDKDCIYTAVIRITKEYVSAYIYSSQGLLFQHELSVGAENLATAQGCLCVRAVGSVNPFTIQIANSELFAAYEGVAEGSEPPEELRVLNCSMEENDTEVDRLPVIDMTFSRPLGSEAGAAFTFSDSTKSFTVTYLTYNKLRISINDMLAITTCYSLSFTELADILGNTVSGSRTFTTKMSLLSLLAPAKLPNLEANLTTVEPMQFSVQNHTGASLPVFFALSVYQKAENGTKRLIGLETLTTNIEADATSVCIPMKKRYHNVSDMKLMAFNSVETLQPLAESYEVAFQETAKSFDLKELPRKLIFKEDFEGGDLPDNVTRSTSYNTESLDNTTAYSGTTAYRVDGSAWKGSTTGGTTLNYTISGLNIAAGTALVMSAMMKASGLCDTTNGNDYYKGCRTTMSIKNSTTGQSKGIYYIDETINGTTDWMESLEYVVCEFPVDTVGITCYLYSSINEGTAWYDDISLYQIGYDPFMDAVLEFPTYKGYIYGENGEGDILVSTNINSYGGLHELQNTVLQAKIVDRNGEQLLLAQTEAVQEEMVSIGFSSKSLPMNDDYYLQLSLINKVTQEELGFREWVIRKRPESYRPNNYFDEYGRFVIDGQPTFLMGIYGMNQVRSTIDDLADTPINVLIPYGYSWLNLKRNINNQIVTGVNDSTLLDYAEQKGIKLVANMKNYLYSKVQSTGQFKNVIQESGDFRRTLEGFADSLNHPAILGYYMADELAPERYGAEVELGSRILAERDPDGFTLNTFSYVYPARTQLRYTDTANCSVYPISKGDGTEDLGKVTEHLSAILSHVPEGNRPFYGVLQSHDCIATVVENSQLEAAPLRGPNEAELRNMAWQGICAGLQGIVWYNYFDMKQEDGQPQNKTFAETWPVLVKVCEEIETYYPVILSTEAPPVVETKAGSWFVHRAKRYNGKTYLFTANTGRSAESAKIRLHGVTEVKNATTGVIYSPDGEGWYTIPYESIGVEILEITQNDYASPQANMSSICFYNGEDAYFVTGTGENLSIHVPRHVNALQYAAKISEGASLYINNEFVPDCGIISLTGVSDLTVKVVAEDTRYETEINYQIVTE